MKITNIKQQTKYYSIKKIIIVYYKYYTKSHDNDDRPLEEIIGPNPVKIDETDIKNIDIVVIVITYT